MDGPPGDAAGLAELMARADPAELLLEVDRRCAARDWDGLVVLRDRCEQAVETGKQLWPVAQFAEYRLALEAPGPYAAGVCRAGAARFAMGPLTEVAASTHSWDELADHLPEPWTAATVSQERVLRGEDLRDDDRAQGPELDLPLVLEEWEPSYPLPTYRSHDLHEGGPEPLVGPLGALTVEPGPPRDLPQLRRALRDVAATWIERSNGGCALATVTGDGPAAVAALVEGSPTVAEVGLGDALARLAWSAASGGAFGPRSGMAAGRSAAWWLLRSAAATDGGGDPLERTRRRLRWWVFSGRHPDAPWNLQLAVADPERGWAAAIDAWDRRDDGDVGVDGPDGPRFDAPRGNGGPR